METTEEISKEIKELAEAGMAQLKNLDRKEYPIVAFVYVSGYDGEEGDFYDINFNIVELGLDAPVLMRTIVYPRCETHDDVYGPEWEEAFELSSAIESAVTAVYGIPYFPREEVCEILKIPMFYAWDGGESFMPLESGKEFKPDCFDWKAIENKRKA